MQYPKDLIYIEEIKEITKILKEVTENYINAKIKKRIDKGCKDFYTDIDLNIEEEIMYKISKKYPNDSFYTEETLKNSEFKERTWTIDPIDGTINYTNNIELYTIQISLFDKTTPVLGFIYIPSENKLFVGIKDNGAYLNGKKIEINKKEKLENSIITIDDISTKDIRLRRKQKSVVTLMMDEALRIRIIGSTGYNFSQLIENKIGAHIIFSEKIWDLIPGILISTEAGAVTNWDINKLNDFSIIASNKELLTEITNLF